MQKKTNAGWYIAAGVGFGVFACFALALLCAGTALAVRVLNPFGREPAVQTAEPAGQQSLPAVNLQGIWQRNRSMAAGWADRYHFYPSGAFHFYPNEMICSEEKIEKIGTWKVENSLLTLTTTDQVIKRFEIYPNGLCSLKEKTAVRLAEPEVEQLPVVDLGTQAGDLYPAVSINGLQYWKFSADASAYGDEKFPE